MSRLVQRIAALASVAALAAHAFGGCALTRTGALEQNCTSDAQCEDDNPCTEQSCSADGFCEFVPVDNSASILQVPQDCVLLQCIAGRVEGTPDDADVPINPCTDASCNGGVLNETPLADGTACEVGLGNGNCSAGECIVTCDDDNAATQCDDANGCTIDSCNNGACVHEALDNEPAPGTLQMVGDCQQLICVQGFAQPLPDNGDLPVDNNDCTEDLCNGGVPSNPPLPPDTPCGNGLSCDTNGQCVGCDEPSDCGGMDTDCSTVICTNTVCGISYAANGTPLPPNQQTPDDCLVLTCDGNGNTVPVAEPNGTSCQDGLYCTLTDSCSGGNCSVTVGNPCPGPDGDGDCSESCDENGMNCDANDPAMSPCDDGIPPANDVCNANGACIGSCGQEPPPPGGACPLICDDCTGNVCTIDCAGSNACNGNTLTCPPGFACLVMCDGSNACKDATINCPAVYACDVTCNGSNGCENTVIQCTPGGTCQMTCSSTSNICKNADLNCGDNDCGATCASSSTPNVNCSMSSQCACTSC